MKYLLKHFHLLDTRFYRGAGQSELAGELLDTILHFENYAEDYLNFHNKLNSYKRHRRGFNELVQKSSPDSPVTVVMSMLNIVNYDVTDVTGESGELS